MKTMIEKIKFFFFHDLKMRWLNEDYVGKEVLSIEEVIKRYEELSSE